MYVKRPDWIVVGDCICCGDTQTVDCRDFDNADIPEVVICDHCRSLPCNASIVVRVDGGAE